MKQIFFVLLLLWLSGCAMNGLFLYPDQIPDDVHSVHFYDYEGERAIYMELGENYQPVLTDSNGNTPDLDYRITSTVFPNRSDKLLHAWYLEPTDTAENGITLFFLHGNAGNIYSQFSLMLPLVKRGYKVFMIDYSGFGHSEGKAKRKFVYTDAMDAFQYFQSHRDRYPYERLVVYGQSLGGHLTAAISHELQDQVDAFVMEGAFSSHDEIAAERSGLGGFARMMVREQYAGVDSIALTTRPKLIIHSREDAVVPYYMGEQLRDAAAEPLDFYAIDKRHILGPVFYGDSIDIRIRKLLDEN